MSIFKCKMCGGELHINPGESVAVCEYCGTTQTLPKLDDDRRANLYDRANHFRRNNDFDKAAGIYEQILNEDKTDAEAYWSLVLCRYGIEYVEDPATHKRVPTVNRAQYTSIFDDEDYKAAIQYADAGQREVYEAEAKAINEIQKGILEISQKEEPFDVFICYKETDANGRRTPDSVLATDLYHQLTQEGFKVFFSRITLEDKLGTAYEPYIFSALNSAKVMVVLGTKPEYFNAVWVKNEWSRYLALIRGGANKVLIPAYRDMDPYDLPEEFSHLQAQDMSKLGFMQDLIRGIKKLTEVDKPASKETVVVQETAANTAPLLKRAFIFLEDGDWDSADEYCEKVLDLDPENAQAYLGKLMAELHVRRQEALANQKQPFDKSNNYQKVMRFGDEALRGTLDGYITHIRQRNEEARLNGLYDDARRRMDAADSETVYKQAAEIFSKIPSYRDADELRQQCLEQAEICRKEAIYNGAVDIVTQEAPNALRNAAKQLAEIPGWRDADQLRAYYLTQADKLEAEEQRRAEEERLAAEKRAEEERIATARKAEEKRKAAEIRKKRRGKIAVIFAAVAVVAIIACIASTKMIAHNKAVTSYNEAVAYLADGDITHAIGCFRKVGNYKDAKEQSAALIKSISASISAAAYGQAIGIEKNGAAVAAGSNYYGQCNVSRWADMIAVSTSPDHALGLKANGTVVAAGKNDRGQCNVSSWSDIVAISAGGSFSIGLKSNGRVVAVGYNNDGRCDVANWSDIVAISAGSIHSIGLRADGTVVTSVRNMDGTRFEGQAELKNVSNWANIVAVSAGGYHSLGLKADGTVVATGNREHGQCDVSGWTDIVAVSAGEAHSIGLRADGTVVATGYDKDGQCNVENWSDIVAVSAARGYTMGLKTDGTVVVAGECARGDYGDVSNWANIGRANTRLPQ